MDVPRDEDTGNLVNFKFGQGDKVVISRSQEIGTVRGRIDYQRTKMHSYLIEYTTGTGCSAEGWFCEDELA